MSQPPGMPPPPPWDPTPPPAPGGPPPGNLFEAKPYDSTGPDGRPVVDRPPVPEEVRDRLVQYLEQAPVVLAAHSLATDLLSPDGRTAVPLTFHTDGTWLWQGSVGYYLKTHGLPPEPALVAHVQSAGFRLPEVSKELQDTAVRIATGQQEAAPRPASFPASFPAPPAPPPSAPPAAPPAAFPYPPGAAPVAPPAAPGMMPPGGFPPAGGMPPGSVPPGGGFVQPHPPGTGSSGGGGRRAAVGIVSVIAAIAVLLGGKAVSGAVRKEMRGGSSASSSGDTGVTVPDASTGGPSASASASASPQPAVVTTLPDYCKGLRPSLPAKVRGIKVDTVTSDSDRRSCQWERLTSANGRNLDVVVDTNVMGSPAKAVENAQKAFRLGWENAADPEFHKGREKVPGLGDEAFASRQVSPIVQGPDEASAKTYWLGGAELFVRKGNVTIEITWTAADAYRTRGRLVQGTNLPYGTARKQATEIAKRILATLK
ncbi:hypothetical protein ACFHW2_06820 [Actinomadura sp. LOL_016]|uniref:hypothetical protein n=1 Tax=unclassified Actinomadura TaxID=2626254 RepID=UPI003A7F9D7C